MSVYKVVDKNGRKIETDVNLHPGEILADELVAREISQKDFSKLIKLQAPHLNDLLKGKRHFSARIALKLEKQLGIDADYWLRVQIAFDLFEARKAMKKELLEN
jgi:antitoxin HigA-1